MNKFLSCDWGTSTLRIRLVDVGTKQVIKEVRTTQGIAETHKLWIEAKQPESERIHFYKEILADALTKFSVSIDNLPIILSGMASSSIGIQEFPYQHFPFTWDVNSLPVHKIETDKFFPHTLFIVSGFRTANDIMRGEETMLLGCEIKDDAYSVCVFPGTHSKHIIVKDRKAIDFKTYMTGELFNLLSEKSILSNSVQKGDDPGAFEAGVKSALTGNLLNNIFMTRTRQIVDQLSTTSNYQYLSGLLIGSELNEIGTNVENIYLVCDEPLRKQYLQALECLPLKKEIFCVDADGALINGQCIIAEHRSFS
jgi:2-dehydro-3-deoxygalactonokinase